jgi:uncharacterized protein (TIGR03000 family)
MKIQEFIPPKDTSPKTPTSEQPARIDVDVPAGAEITFDGVKTTQTGTTRQFVTPPLATGKEFQYEVKGEWKEDGKPVTMTRRVTVRAGERVTVSFAKPTTPETLPAPKPSTP